MLGGASPDPAEDAATRTLATETLVATRKQMIVQLGGLIPHVTVALCQLPNNLVLLTNTPSISATPTSLVLSEMVISGCRESQEMLGIQEMVWCHPTRYCTLL